MRVDKLVSSLQMYEMTIPSSQKSKNQLLKLLRMRKKNLKVVKK